MAVVADRVLVELEAKVDRYNRRIATADQRFNRSMGRMRGAATATERQTEAAFAGIGAAARRMAAVVAASLGVREITRYADAWTEAGNKIAAATQISGIQGATLSDLADAAIEARTAFEPYVDLFARIQRAGANLNITQREVAAATEIVSKAFVAGGASAQEQASGILQLGQALASGELLGEELRAIRENAPLVAQAIAEEFDTTIGGLKKLGEQGELTAERVLAGILNAQGKIEAAFRTTNATIGDSFQNLRTALIRFVGDADDVVGASEKLAEALNALAENLDLVASAAALLAARGLAPLVAALGARLAIAARAGAAAIASLGTAATASATAIGILRGALALLGGPVGAVLIGLTAAGIALSRMDTGARTAAEGIERLQAAIDKGERSLGKLQSVEQSLKSDTEALKDANERLNDAVASGGDVAVSAAQADVAAIQRRIAANEDLRDAIIDTIRANEQALRAEVQVAERAFRQEFAPERDVLTGAETAAFAGPGGAQAREEFQEEIIRRQIAVLDDLTEAAEEALAAGDVSAFQKRFIDARAALLSTKQSAEATAESLRKLETGDDGGRRRSRAVETAEEQAKAFEKLEKRIKALDSQARAVRLGDLTAELVELELALRDLGFEEADTIEPVNRLREALEGLVAEEQKLAQEDVFGEVADSLREMTAEATAIEAGTEAFEDFRREGERSQFLDDFRRKLDAAGVEATEIERTINRLASAFDGLRASAASVEFRSLTSDIKGQIADIRLEAQAMQASLDQGNRSAFENFQAGLSITETIARRQKELAEQGLSEGEIVFQTEPLREALEQAQAIRAEFEGAFRSAGSAGAGTGADAGLNALEQELASLAERRAAIEAVLAAQEGLNPVLDDFAAATAAAAIEQRLLAAAQEAGVEVNREEIAALAASTAQLEQRAAAAGNFGQGVESIKAETAAIEAETEALAQINPALNDYGFAIETALAEQDLLNLAIAAGIPLTDDLREAIRQLAEGYGAASAEARKLSEEQRNFARGVRDFRETSRDVFGNFIQGALDGKKATDILADALDDIAAKLFELSLNSLFDTGGGQQGLSGFIAGLAGVFGGSFSEGGATGGRRGRPAGVVHGEEFVIRAGQAQRYAKLLEAVNDGEAPDVIRQEVNRIAGEAGEPRTGRTIPTEDVRTAVRQIGGDTLINRVSNVIRETAAPRAAESAPSDGSLDLDRLVSAVDRNLALMFAQGQSAESNVQTASTAPTSSPRPTPGAAPRTVGDQIRRIVDRAPQPIRQALQSILPDRMIEVGRQDEALRDGARTGQQPPSVTTPASAATPPRSSVRRDPREFIASVVNLPPAERERVIERTIRETIAGGGQRATFDIGGPTGGQRGKVAGIVHGEEFVVKAGPAQKFRPILEAINADRKLPGFQSGGFVESPPARPINLDLPDLPTRTIERSAAGDTVIQLGGLHVNGVRDVDDFRRSEPQLMADLQRKLSNVARRGTA